MLYNEEVFKVGEFWPAKDSETKARIQKYIRNEKIYKGDHGELDDYEEAFKRIERIIGNFGDYITYVTFVNYQSLISKKITDLIISDEPEISCKEQETIDTIIKNTDFMKKLYQIYIDISRFGDSIVFIRKDGKGNGTFDVLSPQSWFPIINKFNQKEILCHVLAYEIKEENETFLYTRKHYKGYYIDQVFKMQKNTFDYSYLITDEIEVLRSTTKTGLDDFAIVHLSNIITSDTIFGEDDYTQVDSLVKEILIRLSQIARILDVHSSPSMAVPESCLTQDAKTGETYFQPGNTYVMRNKDEPVPFYLTWEGQLTAAYKDLEVLINELSKISEMGSLIKDETDGSQVASSGRALRYKLLAPLLKAKRVAMFTTNSIKELINLVSQIGGKNIKNLANEDISIKFFDGIPNDPVEESQIIRDRRQAGTMSIKRVLSIYDDLQDDQIEEELKELEKETNQTTDNQTTPPLIDSTLTQDDLDEL